VKRLLDYDALTGVSTWHEYDHASKTRIIGMTQDVGPLLEANKRTAIEGSNTMAEKGTMRMHLHARIPVLWREQFIKKYGKDISDPSVRKEYFRELEDPDHRYLKTTWKRHFG